MDLYRKSVKISVHYRERLISYVFYLIQSHHVEKENRKVEYMKGNKAAWEEAFENRKPNWGDENDKILKSQTLPFLNSDTIAELQSINLKGKTIAQFCCNNGRELLSVMQLELAHAVGFDIAENIIEQAKETAKKIEEKHCEFIACNVMEIDDSYSSRFDLIFFTIGGITWFEDLELLFEKVSRCLKQGGIMFINDFHPFMNMLPLPGEDAFDADHLNQLAYPYFKKEPWIENNGMSYITPEYASKTFISFAHTLSGIINSAIHSGLTIVTLNEYNYDVGLTEVYDEKDYPLSFILVARKT